MSEPAAISKAYEPAAVESKWQSRWLGDGCFTADPASPKPAYSIAMPPPNVTGVLTLGHVLNNTIQDILARRARMTGHEVLWLPGTDHAGIATQTVVEKRLRKEEGKTRRDLGREEFLKRVWEWKEKHGGIIIEQLKKLGCSCDWTRERFTMDAGYSREVQRVFVELYKKGLIYRGKRMVNWDPATLTALSDEEVVMKPTSGTLYYFKVQVAGRQPAATAGGAPDFLTIATTRPETIFGDTAIAVNPRDERFARFIGKKAVRPLPADLPLEKKLIPIIADEHIDPQFGTGVLKITPAHDKADFEIGQRHGLPVVDVLNPDGTLNDLAGAEFAGRDRFEARKLAAEKLRELGLLVKEEPYENNVGYSERTDVPMEPRLSEQWFLRYPQVESAREAVSAGLRIADCGLRKEECAAGAAIGEEASNADSGAGGAEPLSAIRNPQSAIAFRPERWANVFEHWMENIQDWCISRQLWWGHQVPVWRPNPDWGTREQVESTFAYIEELKTSNRADYVVRFPETGRKAVTEGTEINIGFSVTDGEAASLEEIPADENELTGITIEFCLTAEANDIRTKLQDLGFTQDPDVLDTWFSSWLWPFATMDAVTRAKFYPTTDLVTGPDIIFFWVARMIMAGFEFTGEKPFSNVFFTGLIRDAQGRKMSKSLGNSPDPLDLIAGYGADGLRFGLMRIAPQGADIRFDEKQIEEGRNFANKFWNAARFRQMHGPSFADVDLRGLRLSPYSLDILAKLDALLENVERAYAGYRFSEIAGLLYEFFWSEYCDWFVEAAKTEIFSGDATAKESALGVMDYVLSRVLRLLHPFMPHITEELWERLGFSAPNHAGGNLILFAEWPRPSHLAGIDRAALAEALPRVAAVYDAVRAARNLRAGSRVPANKKVRFVLKSEPGWAAGELPTFARLVNAEEIALDPFFKPASGVPRALTPMGELYLPLAGLVDAAAEQERLKKEIAKVEAELQTVRRKLSNENFLENAPAAVVAEHRKRETDWEEKLAQLQVMRAALDA